MQSIQAAGQKKIAKDRPVVLVSWDGTSLPWGVMHLDSAPEFECILFDYSGRQPAGQKQIRGLNCTVLSGATECKGQIYQALADYLLSQGLVPEYVALLDDDIAISFADINRVLHLGRIAGLDVFSPTLSHDSMSSHKFIKQRSNIFYRDTHWVEVMMPFYRGELFLAGAPHFKGNISSWGIDKYLFPTLQLLLDMPRTSLIDAVMAMHMRPISSGKKVFANGLTADQEREKMRHHCMALLVDAKPSVRGGEQFHRIFSSQKGALRKLWFLIRMWQIRLFRSESK